MNSGLKSTIHVISELLMEVADGSRPLDVVMHEITLSVEIGSLIFEAFRSPVALDGPGADLNS